MSRSDRRDPRLEQTWRTRLQLWRRSGCSIREFCRQQQLTESNFYFWKRELQLREQEPTGDSLAGPALVPVRVVAVEAIELVLQSGVIVRVPASHDPDVVARLVAALEGRA